MSFLEELKRRNVVKVALAYLAVAWTILAVADVILNNLDSPPWLFRAILAALLLGFPIVIALAWAFQWTPDGLRHDPDEGRLPVSRILVASAVVISVVGSGYFVFVDFVGQSDRSETDARVSFTSDDEFLPAHSVAVLAFDNISPDPEQEYFAEGLSEEILTMLSRVRELKVPGRTSSFSFKGRGEDLREIGRQLGVRAVLEGSVRKFGDRVRITANLVDASDGTSMWSDTYEPALGDIFTAQEEVAVAIINALQVEVGVVPTRGRPTENQVAYMQFLRARALLDAQQGAEAIDLLQQAVLHDSGFAEAFELLAFAYWQQGSTTIDIAESQALCFETSARAIDIDSSLAFATGLNQLTDPGGPNVIAAIENLYKAVREQPSNSAPFRTLFYELTLRGYLQEANELANRFSAREPLSPLVNYSIGESLVALGFTEQALPSLQFSLDLDNAFARGTVPAFYIAMGMDDEASQLYVQYLLPANTTGLQRVSALIELARDPNTDGAVLDEKLSVFINDLPMSYHAEWFYQQNLWYLAFGYLDAYFDTISASDLSSVRWSEAYTQVWQGTVLRRSGFTADSRYIEIARQLGILDTWEKRGPPDFCEKAVDEWVCH